MAVVLIVELGESPQLDLELNTLQFVGIADHSQLKNRDLAEQHPISAIDGLTEKHSEYDQTLSDIGETLSAQGQVLLTFDETLTEHTQVLALQGETLEEQGQQLEQQGESITSMGETLDEHSLALAELDEFKNNIATQTDIEEVLDHE